MKKEEKILLAVGGIAVVGAILYFGSRPKYPVTPYYGPVSYQPSGLQQGVAAANALAPVASNLVSSIENIFGDSNSGGDASTTNLPATQPDIYNSDPNALGKVASFGGIC
jgi:hypothetical protein